MFALILTILSIALVAMIAFATINYGGEAMQKNQTKVAVTTILNEGQQLQAAFSLYRAEKSKNAVSIAELTSNNYLKSVPANWDVAEGYAFRTTDEENVCLESNKKRGINLIPVCSDTAYSGLAVCCSHTPT